MESEFIRTIKLAPGLLKLKSSREANSAINDLLDFNYFSVLENGGGPYDITLDSADNKLIMIITSRGGTLRLPLSLRFFRGMVKDYFLLFESYHDAVSQGHPEKIEALDMGRRSIHNEGAEKFISILENKINIDFETARRFYTIISALMMGDKL